MPRKSHPLIILRRSCLTGKVVWIYRGPSKGAARKAYHCACKKELERVENWQKNEERRRTNFARMLADLLADIPFDTPLKPEQQAEAERLQALGRQQTPCDMEFYNHIVEERRRREEDKEIRRKMKERNP